MLKFEVDVQYNGICNVNLTIDDNDCHFDELALLGLENISINPFRYHDISIVSSLMSRLTEVYNYYNKIKMVSQIVSPDKPEIFKSKMKTIDLYDFFQTHQLYQFLSSNNCLDNKKICTVLAKSDDPVISVIGKHFLRK